MSLKPINILKLFMRKGHEHFQTDIFSENVKNKNLSKLVTFSAKAVNRQAYSFSVLRNKLTHLKYIPKKNIATKYSSGCYLPTENEQSCKSHITKFLFWLTLGSPWPTVRRGEIFFTDVSIIIYITNRYLFLKFVIIQFWYRDQ